MKIEMKKMVSAITVAGVFMGIIHCAVAEDLETLKSKALLYLPMEKEKILGKPENAKLTTNGTAVFSEGKKGQALIIDREGISVKGLTVTGKNLINNETGSIAFWMRPLVSYEENKARRTFFSTRKKDAHYIYINKKCDFYFQAKSNGKYPSSHFNLAWWKKPQWSTELWYHMVVTWDKEKVEFYFNGVRKHTKKRNLSFTEQTDKLSIGWSGKDGSSVDALLDEFYIFDKVLSDDEVGSLMADK